MTTILKLGTLYSNHNKSKIKKNPERSKLKKKTLSIEKKDKNYICFP